MSAATITHDVATAADNIAKWRELATEADVHAGRDWYPLAAKIAASMADAYGVPLEVAAGVIAVLSPQTEWLANVRGAETILRAHAAGDPMPRPGDVETTYYDNVKKAWNIVRTGEAFPRCNGTRPGSREGTTRKCHPTRDECAARAHLHGPKVVEFFETILGKRAGRVVDVWATRAADLSPYDVLDLRRGDPRADGVPGTRFAMLQRAYEIAAERFGEDPRDTQAIVWTKIRRTWRKPGAGLQTELAIPF